MKIIRTALARLRANGFLQPRFPAYVDTLAKHMGYHTS